ncbi:MAG: Hsp20/alpha crystallin family protein [Candidatus Latescibacteria bacterium]|nr:Hsp20/alpha crystallin family protein [Candidatus Latescibacterota bacterium]
MPQKGKKVSGGEGLGGLFKGIGNVIDLLSELAEKGEEIRQMKEFTGTGALKDLKGIYGFSVKVGLGGEPTVQSFGNIRETEKGPVVEEVREPLVDLFDEEKTLQIVAEMPGVEEKDVIVEIKDDILTITAETGKKKYSKEVLLPVKVRPTSLSKSYRNGILEITLQKAG